MSSKPSVADYSSIAVIVVDGMQGWMLGYLHLARSCRKVPRRPGACSPPSKGSHFVPKLHSPICDPHSRDGVNALDTGDLHDPICLSDFSYLRHHFTLPPEPPLDARRCLLSAVENLRRTSVRNPPGRQKLPPRSAPEACIARRVSTRILQLGAWST